MLQTTEYGGTVSNGGTINELTYFGGDYQDSYAGTHGSIGTLTLAGNSTGIEWGNVGNVVFSDNGNGILSIKAFVNENVGLRSMSAAAATPDFTFAGINVDSIDLTNGKIMFDLTALGEFGESFMNIFGEEGLLFTSLFGSADVAGDLKFIEVVMDEDADWGTELFAMLNGNTFSE